MRHQEIEVGREYLTRNVRRVSPYNYKRMDLTSGLVRVEEGPMLTRRRERRWRVTWLMRDGSERTDRTLPRWLTARRFLVAVPAPQERPSAGASLDGGGQDAP